jgi:hypothetical protein
VTIPKEARAVRKRAPYGALQEAILSVFKDGSKLGNSEVRGALLQARYPYAYSNLNLRKTLARLAKAKKLHAENDGERVWYSLPKSA